MTLRTRAPIRLLLESQAARASIPIPGLGAILYSSLRVPGCLTDPVLRLPILGQEVPKGVDSVELEVRYRDQAWSDELDATPGLVYERVLGEAPVARRDVAVVDVLEVGRNGREWLEKVGVGPWDARTCRLGGWLLPFQHHLEIETGTLKHAGGYTQSVTPKQSAQGWSVELTTTGERMVFDDHGRLQSIDELSSRRRQLTLSYSHGHLVEVSGRTGRTSRLVWGDDHRSVTVVPFQRESTELLFDGDGWLSQVTGDASTPSQVEHDSYGRLLGVTDSSGHYGVRYDGRGRVTALTGPTGRRDVVVTEEANSVRYALIGDLEDESSLVVTTEPDGRVVRTRRCCGSPAAVTSTTHLDGSHEIALSDGTRLVRRRLQLPSQLWGTPTGTPVFERELHSPDGARRTTRRWSETVDGTVHDVVEIDGRRSERWVDADGTTHRRSPAGRVTTVRRDPSGRVTHANEPGRPPISFHYNESGLVDRVTGGASTVSIEARLDNTVRIEADGAAYGLTIDATSGLARHIRPDGVHHGPRAVDGAVEFVVGDHAVMRLSSVEPGSAHLELAALADTSEPSGIDFAWNQAGHQQITTPETSVTFEPASDDRRSRAVDHGDGAVTFGYDPVGNLSHVTTSWGESIEFERDGPRLLAERSKGRATATVAHHWEGFNPVGYSLGDHEVVVRRDPDGLVTHVGPIEVVRDATTGLFTERRHGQLVETLERDEHLRVVARRVTTTSGGVLAEITDGYDAAGRRNRRRERFGDVATDHEYRYDAVGRLAAVLSGTDSELLWRAEYDERGNRTRLWRGEDFIESEFDARDRLVRQADTVFKYDRDDRMALATDPTGSTRYGYDGLGRLVSVDGEHGRIQYVYDGLGRRVARYLDGEQTDAHIWSHDRVIGSVDAAGTLTTFLYGDGRVPIAAYIGDRLVHLLSDHLGTIRLTLDPVAGALIASTDVDVDGRPIGASTGLPLGFGRGLVDALTGTVCFGHRVYDPERARWLQRDPLLFASRRSNLHDYCSGDPLNRIDPGGLTDIPAVLGPEGGAPTHPAAPQSGVGICANDWGPFDHGMVSVDGKLYGWNPTPDNLANWKEQTGEKLGDKSVECEEVPDVDPECVMEKIQDATGQFKDATPEFDATVPFTDYKYFPPSNVCWNPVFDAIRDCGGDPYEHIPTENSPTLEKLTREYLYPAQDVVNEAAEFVQWIQKVTDS